MSVGTCKIWVERVLPQTDNEWAELPVEIEYEYTRADPPTRYYPGAPEHLEILDTSIPLTTDEEQRAEQTCWEDVRKRQKEAKEP